jgi:hypothetical protein
LTSKPAENIREEPVISKGREPARAPAITAVIFPSISTVRAFTGGRSRKMRIASGR